MINDFKEVLLSLDRITIKDMITSLGDEKTSIELIEELVVPTLESIGDDWEKGVVALSQVYMSSRIIEELMDDILPPSSPDRKNQPATAIVVLEDNHLLGKRIVYSILRASGFELFDYKVMKVNELLSRVKEDKIDVLLISTLMLPSALRIKDVASNLKESDLNVKIIVGGAPFRFDDQLWKEVGADAMCKDASEVIRTISGIFGGIS